MQRGWGGLLCSLMLGGMTHFCLHDESSLPVLYSVSSLSKHQDGGHAWCMFEDLDSGLMVD